MNDNSVFFLIENRIALFFYFDEKSSTHFRKMNVIQAMRY